MKLSEDLLCNVAHDLPAQGDFDIQKVSSHRNGEAVSGWGMDFGTMLPVNKTSYFPPMKVILLGRLFHNTDLSHMKRVI